MVSCQDDTRCRTQLHAASEAREACFWCRLLWERATTRKEPIAVALSEPPPAGRVTAVCTGQAGPAVSVGLGR